MATRDADLGSFSLELGLASLSRLDPVRLCSPILEDLCEHIRRNGFAPRHAWQPGANHRSLGGGRRANHGDVAHRHGATAGQFGDRTRLRCLLPASFRKKLLEKELRASAEATGTTITALIQSLEPIIEEIRLHGISRASGSLNPGINGFSAPYSTMGTHGCPGSLRWARSGNFDTGWDGPLAFAIRDAARALSARLGHGETSPDARIQRSGVDRAMSNAGLDRWIAATLENTTLRTNSLIITVFGDAIAPHREAVWLGDLIELLAPLQTGDRAVRTSVFAWFRKGWLQATPVGRRSAYRLTNTGQRQVSHAYRRIYDAPQATWNGEWQIVALPEGALRRRIACAPPRPALGWLWIAGAKRIRASIRRCQ